MRKQGRNGGNSVVSLSPLIVLFLLYNERLIPSLFFWCLTTAVEMYDLKPNCDSMQSGHTYAVHR